MQWTRQQVLHWRPTDPRICAIYQPTRQEKMQDTKALMKTGASRWIISRAWTWLLPHKARQAGTDSRPRVLMKKGAGPTHATLAMVITISQDLAYWEVRWSRERGRGLGGLPCTGSKQEQALLSALRVFLYKCHISRFMYFIDNCINVSGIGC